MGADATINIDVMLANLPKFKNDVSFVDDVLTRSKVRQQKLKQLLNP